MRGAIALFVLSVALPACVTDPGPARVFEDGNVLPPEDGGFVDADAGFLDAFSWPDTGPPLPTLVPAQSWSVSFTTGADSFTLIIDIDARAESGIVRAVGGAGGRASSVIFDILPGGTLRARSPILMGIPGDHTCSYDTASVDTWVLSFTDADHDGIRETLTRAESGGTFTRSGPMMPAVATGESVFAHSIMLDTRWPVIALDRAAPVIGVDPIVVTASEPIEPSFMPRIVGPHTFVLTPDVGASAPARWSLDTRDLPVGHYDLVLGAAMDLTGRTPTGSLPTLSFDVTAPTPPAIDGVDPGVVAVRSASPQSILGDAAGEVPLEGLTSLLVEGRSVIVFDSAAGRRQLSMSMRFEGPTSVPGFNAFLSVYDAHGALVGQTSISAFLNPPGVVDGFGATSVTQTAAVAYTAARAGRYYAVLEPGGPDDAACTGMGMPQTPGVAVTLDAFTLL